MEKLLYPVWKPGTMSADDFRDTLLTELAPELIELGLRGLRVSVVDSEVEPAAGLRQENLGAAMDAMISVWLDSSVYREPIESAIAARVERLAGYLVTESEPLCSNTAEGARTNGMSQVVFLQRPERLSEAEWIEIWHGSHTQVAIDTQSTFGYRQNVVARALTPEAPAIDAIIEENFPAEAMTSQHAFYAADSEEEYQARLNAMIESCARFIDFDKINVCPTSEYLLKPV
jgi:hypothetical protein